MTATTPTDNTLYLALDAEEDLAQASALDGFHDLDDEARAALVAAYEDAFATVAKRLYGTQVDLLIGGADADPGEVHRHLSRNADEDAAREAWQAIHEELDLRELPDRIDLTDGRHVHEQVTTAPALAFGVCDPAYGDPEVWIVRRSGTDEHAFNGEPFASRAWEIDGVDGLDVIVDELGYEPVPGATWEESRDFTTLAVRPY